MSQVSSQESYRSPLANLNHLKGVSRFSRNRQSQRPPSPARSHGAQENQHAHFGTIAGQVRAVTPDPYRDRPPLRGPFRDLSEERSRHARRPARGHVSFHLVGGEEAAGRVGELRALYSEVYAEPPHEWGDDHAALFADRFGVQRCQEGFALVEAWNGVELAGFGFGVTLQPPAPWWHNLTTTLPAEVTTERPGRTFALVELLVRPPWRRQHIAQAIHDLLLKGRPEERASLAVLPAAASAQAAYRTGGWRKVAQKSNPLPGSPLFDVLVRPLADP